MTSGLSARALEIAAVLSCLFAAFYLLPDILTHRLGVWVMTRARAQGVCALTFDDGPDPVFTPLILDVLKGRGRKATFFVLGKKAARYPDIMSRMASEGHEVGVHGWDHRHPWLLGPLTSATLTAKALEATKPYRGDGAAKFRPPWGYWSAWTLASSRGFRRVMWCLPGNDWTRGATADSVTEQVTARVAPGSIVLLHDGGSYSEITAQALPRILDILEEKGLRQVTVGDLERMGAQEDSLFRILARKVQDRVEARFERDRRLIPCGEEGLVRLETMAHDGPATRLMSGLTIDVGDPVAEIHLNSRKIAALYERETVMRARVRMFRGAESGFSWMANWLAEDPAGREVVALRSTTLLDREMKHFGFEVHPLPVWPHILVGSYMRWLSYLYRAAGKSRHEDEGTSLVRRLTPRRAWMGRDEFIAKYGRKDGPTVTSPRR